MDFVARVTATDDVGNKTTKSITVKVRDVVVLMTIQQQELVLELVLELVQQQQLNKVFNIKKGG